MSTTPAATHGARPSPSRGSPPTPGSLVRCTPPAPAATFTAACAGSLTGRRPFNAGCRNGPASD
eukprot:8495864-Lingulodinium_polyedra.AAC.1